MITTLTLSPVFDVHVNIPELRLGRENLANSRLCEVGGKGINISRVLLAAGIEHNAIVALPRDGGDEFLAALRAVGIEPKTIECDGRIRENITVHTSSEETRISFKGFNADASLLTKAEALIPDGGTVTFSGSLPEGIDKSSTEAFLTRLRKRGAKLVIDSKSVTLDMIQRIKPWLIKPNAEECEEYFGALDENGLYTVARRLHESGIENVMISLGGDGAILAAGARLYRAHVPKIDALSTVGAGDSTVAGFIAAEGKSPDERLRLAVSFGSAACLVSGTKPPKMDEVKRIYDSVQIEEITL